MKLIVGILVLFAWIGVSGEELHFETFPKIDIHVHIYEDTPAFHELMEEINLVKVLNVSVRAMDPEVFAYRKQGARQLAHDHPHSFAWASTFPLWNINELGYVGKVINSLDENFVDGALAVKVWKDIGLEAKDPHGKHIHLDDPIFDPIVEHIVANNKPLLGHLAEPIHAWRPLEKDNPLHRYQHANPQWHFYGKADIPSYERNIAARDARIAKHPEMTFVAFHLGSMSHDVGMVDSRLAIYPNMYAGVAGRVRFLTRQPSEKVRDFIIKYQDRLMYGTDLTIESWGARSTPQTPEANQRFKERLKKRYRDDWDYFTSEGQVDYDGYETQGLGLPKEVLEKFYYKNAQRIIPGL